MLCAICAPLLGRHRERELDAIRTSLRAATDHSENRQREAKRLATLLEETREEYARCVRVCGCDLGDA